jgi:predicted RNase H-like HicB family nuclease
MGYGIVFEKTKTGWSAYAPDLPGLGVAGATLEETSRLLQEGIELHLRDLSLSEKKTLSDSNGGSNPKLSTSH